MIAVLACVLILSGMRANIITMERLPDGDDIILLENFVSGASRPIAILTFSSAK